MNTNPITMFLMPKTQDVTNYQSQSGSKLDTAKSNSFEKVLGNIGMEKQEEQESVDHPLHAIETDSEEEMKLELSGLNLETLEELILFMKQSKELSDEEMTLLEEMTDMVYELQELGEESLLPIINLASSELIKDIFAQYREMDLTTQSDIDTETFKLIPFQQIHAIDLTELQRRAGQIYEEVEQLLNQAGEKSDNSKVASKILELLTDWQKLSQSGGKNVNLLTGLDTGNKQLLNVWQDLVHNFQNRTSMNQRNQYQLDAKISNTDVVRWLSHALDAEVQSQIEKVTVQPAALSTMPISKVEQFVIHINQTQGNTSPDKQLMEQFQKIMDTNRLTGLQNSRGNLAITLKPGNLGEMLVRFTQVNGEMMVKILVTSAAAKDMLEGNLHQLRNMFSPHQVVIEKQDAAIPQSQAAQNEQSSTEQHDEKEEQNHPENQQKQGEDDSFSSIFEDLVLNEKV